MDVESPPLAKIGRAGPEKRKPTKIGAPQLLRCTVADPDPRRIRSFFADSELLYQIRILFWQEIYLIMINCYVLRPF